MKSSCKLRKFNSWKCINSCLSSAFFFFFFFKSWWAVALICAHHNLCVCVCVRVRPRTREKLFQRGVDTDWEQRRQQQQQQQGDLISLLLRTHTRVRCCVCHFYAPTETHTRTHCFSGDINISGGLLLVPVCWAAQRVRWGEANAAFWGRRTPVHDPNRGNGAKRGSLAGWRYSLGWRSWNI